MDESALGLQQNVSLQLYTTLRIGGPAKWLALLTRSDQVQALLQWADTHSLPWVVIGKGSNLLVNDAGFQGLLLVNRIEHEEWDIQGDCAYVTIGSGSSLPSLAARAAKEGWAGLEFACGIPATIGGAVAMNAGAHGAVIGDCLHDVQVWSQGQVKRLPLQELALGYRSSRFHTERELILEATFKLHRDEKALERVKEMTAYRLKTQPWKSATAGCFFRNPKKPPSSHEEPGQLCSAGALIERAGLKGFSIAGAQVSPIHANFLVNNQTATAKDFIELCSYIRREVKEKFGYDLEGEVRYLEETSSQMKII